MTLQKLSIHPTRWHTPSSSRGVVGTGLLRRGDDSLKRVMKCWIKFLGVVNVVRGRWEIFGIFLLLDVGRFFAFSRLGGNKDTVSRYR